MATDHFAKLLVDTSKNKPVILKGAGVKKYYDTERGKYVEASPHQSAMHLAAENGHDRIILAFLYKLESYMKVCYRLAGKTLH